ncbi:MAG: FAD-dependent 5-carboxymethylaminomethyl-2-thiouridine(34) oxidoreductase MnmC [Sulfurovum sp.]|nr:FAD-dependent 5-carboxymethylaminomethyl-2-thiouridine(34) oxidoreductase MnmC [Sulfurovum sp.]
MTHIYDSIIIGAGIAGATLAHTLTKKNQKVLVLDKNGIASGGSGAAGAFVSPKIGKGSALQVLTNEAFEFTKDFYLSTCPEYFHQTGVIRIPKDEVDAKKFTEYKAFNDNKYEWYSKEKLQSLGINTESESFYFPEAGVCDAIDICIYLLKDIEVKTEEVVSLDRTDGQWNLLTPHSSLLTKNVVLATGFESKLVDLRYMGIRGTWGTRGDFSSNLDLKASMHQSMSIGANMNGIIRLGATHEKEITDPLPCSDMQALSLEKKASAMIDTSDFKLLEAYCGMRAGSKDYFPLAGEIIDVPRMLEEYPALLSGAKPEFKYVENLYICNGMGGRGFVFAPLIAKMLAELIVDDKKVDDRVSPDRLFLKWCRKLHSP